MEPTPMHTLLLTSSCRIPPENACFIGLAYYPEAIPHSSEYKEQGPLPSVQEAIDRHQPLNQVPVWIIRIPKPKRHDDGTDLLNGFAAGVSILH
eukprot:7077362-Karenia_brevis.AAC.1